MKKNLFLVPMLVLSSLPLLAGCTNSCTVTVINNNPGMGEVSGAGKYKKGARVELIATPFDTYSFVNWDNGGKGSKRAKWSFTVEESITIYANFENTTYSIKVKDSSDKTKFFGTLSGSATSKWGEETTLEVINTSGYKIDNWINSDTQEVISEGKSLKVEMPAHDLNVECTFSEHTLYFGHYPQDKVKDNGLISELAKVCQESNTYFEYNGSNYYCYLSSSYGYSYYTITPLEWDVVEETEDSYLLITRKSVSAYTVPEEEYDTYKNSGIRSFLTETFYNDAFSDEDKEKMLNRDIEAEQNQILSDKVFLPYRGSSEQFFEKHRVFQKCSYNTELADAMNAIVLIEETGESMFLIYYVQEHKYFDYYGSAARDGCYALFTNIWGVRPMIQIKK